MSVLHGWYRLEYVLREHRPRFVWETPDGSEVVITDVTAFPPVAPNPEYIGPVARFLRHVEDVPEENKQNARTLALHLFQLTTPHFKGRAIMFRVVLYLTDRDRYEIERAGHGSTVQDPSRLRLL